MNEPLQYTTLDLFLYDLADGIGQQEDEITENRRKFWQKVYGKTLDDTALNKLAEKENNLSNYIELFGSGKDRVAPFESPLDGYYYPVKLGDTYALQIDCSGKKDDPDWNKLSTLERLPKIKEIILEKTHGIPETLGKNWLLWGQLTSNSLPAETIAKDCYNASFSENIVKFTKKGLYQGATVFEVEKYDNTPDGLNRNHYCLIVLFNPHQTKDEIGKIIPELYRDLIQLFHYRNKILWVYENSRQLKQSLKKTLPTVQHLIDSISDSLITPRVNLNQLQQNLAIALSISHTYQTNVSYLQESLNNLEINTGNYQKRSQTMIQKDSNADLEFLDRFHEYARNKYITQITSDIGNLNAGSQPLNNMIATIQGIIEIEKTKNERTLNKTIAIVSTGIGTAGLTATTFTKSQEIITTWFPLTPKQPIPASYYWYSFALAFGLSVAIGLSSALLVKFLLDKRG